jgi:NitT/TauT family transport system substrate-binding protein
MLKYIVFTVSVLSAVPAWAAAPLQIGLLQIEDSVPFYVAEQEGFYAAQGLDVKLVPFLSALERDSALAAGAIDGGIDDPVGAILFDQGRGMLKITSLCLGAVPAEGIFAILAAPGSAIDGPDGLKHTPIAISGSTIIEYVTDRLLEKRGFKRDEIKKVEVRQMPIRMQMLLSGSVPAATLPEPLASIAVSKGARILLSDGDSDESLSQTVIVFRAETLAKKKAEVAAFFKAYDQAVRALNANPEKYRALFIDKGRIPPQLAAHYPIPVYPLPAPFSRALYEPVMTWLTAKKLVPPLAYETMVATDFPDKASGR